MKIWTTSNGHQVIRAVQGRCNIYLVFNGSQFIMVDTGVRMQWDSLVNALDALKIDKDALQALVLTHTHFDHAENAARVKGRYAPDVYVHKSEAGYLEKGNSPLPEGSLVITRWLTSKLFEKPRFRFPYSPVIPDVLVEEHIDLKPLGFEASIIHTAGHSAGSLSVIVDQEIAIVGDTMWGLLEKSVFPPLADQPRQLVASWKKLLDTGCQSFLPAHGNERSRSLVLKQYERFKAIYALE